MVGRVETSKDGSRVTGLHYHRDGRWRFQRARNVVLAGYSIETPRLLLTDFMPIPAATHRRLEPGREIIRQIEVEHGEVQVATEIDLRPGHAQRRPKLGARGRPDLGRPVPVRGVLRLLDPALGARRRTTDRGLEPPPPTGGLAVTLRDALVEHGGGIWPGWSGEVPG